VAVENTKASKFRLIASTVGLAVGSGLMLLSDLAAFGGGALIFILSLLFIGPTTVQAFAALTRPVMTRLGVVSRMSSQNLSRQPKRSAATSNALAIGLFLVTAVSLTGAGVKHWVTGKLNDLSSADFVVMTTAAELPPPVVNSINKITGLSRLLVTNGVPVTLDGSPTFLNAVSPAELKKFGVKSTFATSENNLGGGVAVVAGMGPQRGVGETVKFVDTAGRTISLKITAIVEPSVDTFSLGALVEPATLTKLGLESKPMSALMKVERGQKKAVQKQLNAATKGYSTVFVSEGNILGELVGQAFDFLLNAVNGLLGMSVLIAGIGIVNTLTLSVFERRRELGLLRAVGLTRRETRRMVRLEALQLSLLGTLVGMAAGALLAFLLLRKTDIGSYPIEWVRIGVIFAAGVAIGFLAAFFPARRATRMDVLEALAAE
jgi:putative ABC transport system permease protein